MSPRDQNRALKLDRTLPESFVSFARRLAAVLLFTSVAVFFSEKAYWYVQGYAWFVLVVFYAFMVYPCLWLIEHFKVSRLSEGVMVAAVFAFLVEGVLTPVLYEGGLSDLSMPLYFLGWHGLLSVVVGWQVLRVWLVEDRWFRVVMGGVLFGGFWGLWSLTFWLPENAGHATEPARWATWSFGLHAVTFTATLAAAHGLLGRGVRLPHFSPSRLERVLALICVAALFAMLVLPAVPWAPLKLLPLLAIPIAFLWLSRGKAEQPGRSGLMHNCMRPARWRALTGLLVMPASATSVYAVAGSTQPSDESLRSLMEGLTLLQMAAGATACVAAAVTITWRSVRTRCG